MKKTMKKTVCLVVAVCFLLSMILGGCGADQTTTPPASDPPASAPDADSSADQEVAPADEEIDLTYLEDLIAQYSQPPQFLLDAPPVDARAIMEGKKIFFIPYNGSNPFGVGMCERAIEQLELMGAEGFMWESSGTADNWSQGIQSAISQDYDLVSLMAAINPGVLANSWELLKEAGIPLLTEHYGQPGPIDSADYRLGVDCYNTGEIMAAWCILKGGPDVKVAILSEYDTENGPMLAKGITDTFDKYAPNAYYEEIIVPVNDWATKAQAETQNAIQRISGLDYVIPIYDSMSQYVYPGIEMAGATDTVKIVSYNATPFVVDMMREGKVEMLVGESMNWIAYATVDMIIRILGGEEVIMDEMIGRYIFTQENAEEAGVPADYALGYGDAYMKGYHKLWGLE